MNEANPVSTPMSNGEKLSKTHEPRTEGDRKNMKEIPLEKLSADSPWWTLGSAGSNHDAAVFSASGLGSAVMNENLDIPPARNLPETNISFPFFLVADSAFPFHRNIIRPYAGSYLEQKCNIFNYRISRARRTIESTFGILSQRWRVLLRPIVASLEVSEVIVQAVVVLHNLLQTSELEIPVGQRNYCPTEKIDNYTDRGELIPGEWSNPNNLQSVHKTGSNNASVLAKTQRNILADYFVSETGEVEWQYNYVNKGALPSNVQARELSINRKLHFQVL